MRHNRQVLLNAWCQEGICTAAAMYILQDATRMCMLSTVFATCYVLEFVYGPKPKVRTRAKESETGRGRGWAGACLKSVVYVWGEMARLALAATPTARGRGGGRV